MEEEERELETDVVGRRLNTMLPLEIHRELTLFAQKNASTGLGKWDYGVAFRILLERSKLFDIINERINQLEVRIAQLEGKETSEKGVKTFGGGEIHE